MSLDDATVRWLKLEEYEEEKAKRANHHINDMLETVLATSDDTREAAEEGAELTRAAHREILMLREELKEFREEFHGQTKRRRVDTPKTPKPAELSIDAIGRLLTSPETRERLRTVELKAELRRRGLSTSGVKAVLLQRLLDNTEKQPASAGESEPRSDV